MKTKRQMQKIQVVGNEPRTFHSKDDHGLEITQMG